MFHGHAGYHHDHQGYHAGDGADGVARPARGRVQGGAFLLLLLAQRLGQPAAHPRGDPDPGAMRGAQRGQPGVGEQDQQDQDQPGLRADQAGQGADADRGHPQADRALQRDHAAVQGDPPGHDRAQAEQGGQVEHVRAEHDAHPDGVLAAGERGGGGRDLGRVGGQRGDQPEHGLGEPEALAEAFDPDDQDRARGQAERRADDEREKVRGHRFRVRRRGA